MKKLENQLTEEQKMVAKQATERMQWARYFLMLMIVLFVGGFLWHLVQAV